MPKPKQIFLSWSKDRAEKAATHLKEWIERLFEERVTVYLSTVSIRRGDDWWLSLSRALKESHMAIVCVTADSVASRWVNFEAGAIAYSVGNGRVCPLLIDVPPSKLADSPLAHFQRSTIRDKESVRQLINSINEMDGDGSTEVLRNKDALDHAFEDTWIDFFHKIQELIRGASVLSLGTNTLSKIAEKLLEKYKIDRLEASFEYGVITAIPGKDFHPMRRDFVIAAKDELTIVGSSLHEAFDTGNDRTDISRIIEGLVDEHEPTRPYILNVLLSEPRNFAVSRNLALSNDDSDFDVDESPLHRITQTLRTLLKLADGDRLRRIRLSIYFIPLLQIDHIIQAGDLMIIRNTMLWTMKGDLKGTWMLCQKIQVEELEHPGKDESKYAMYNVYERYIAALKEESILIEAGNFARSAKHKSRETDADRFHEAWRKKFAELDPTGESVRLFKLYRKQLVSHLHSTWDMKYRHYSPEVHVSKASDIFRPRGKAILTREDLFRCENLLGERVQQTLLDHIKGTEDMLNEVVRHYDKHGFAQVYPSFDLGIPNNVQRLAGGFATGMFVLWRCGTPIVPIDATVNTCSSSVYWLDDDQFDFVYKNFNEAYLNEIFLRGHENDFLNSFSSGNHFIAIARSQKTGKKYMFLHASAKEFKYTTLGLYPYPGVWYWEKIRTYKSKNGSRYLRYLKDEEASTFITTASKLPDFNKSIHDWFAAAIVGSDNVLNNCVCTKHHYYMPTTYSIALGTFVERPEAEVPIFSHPGRPIYMFKLSTASDQPWTLNLAGSERCLVPHGYGQTLIDGSSNLFLDLEGVDSEKKTLVFNGRNYDVAPRVSLDIASAGVGVRDFGASASGKPVFFENGRRYFSGTIVDVYDQLACFQKGKVVFYQNDLLPSS